MDVLTIANPLLWPIIIIVAVVASRRMRPPAKRVVAVLSGCLAGYGIGVSVNALAINVAGWLFAANVFPGSASFDVRVSTGDIMTGFMIAGGGLGWLTSLFIREDQPGHASGRDNGATAASEPADGRQEYQETPPD